MNLWQQLKRDSPVTVVHARRWMRTAVLSLAFLLLLMRPLRDAVFPGEVGRWIVLVLMGVVLIRLAMRVPSLVALVLVLMAGIGGGALVPFTAAFIVLLAAREQRLRLNLPRSFKRIVRSLALAVVAYLLTLPFLSLGAGSSSPTNVARSPSSAPPGRNPGWLNRLVRRVTDFFSSENPGEATLGGGQPPDDRTWWPYVLAAVVVALAVVLWVWWRRRRSGRGPSGPAPVWSLARLEAIGSRVGRPREPHEGAMAYGDAVATHTGDARLRRASALVSGQVYASPQSEETHVRDGLSRLEADPPLRPPRPNVAKRVGAAIVGLGRRYSLRQWVIGGVGAVSMGLLVALGLSKLSQLPAEAASGDRFGAALASIDDVAANELIRWEYCSASPVLGWTEAHTIVATADMQRGIVRRLSNYGSGAVDTVWVISGASTWLVTAAAPTEPFELADMRARLNPFPSGESIEATFGVSLGSGSRLVDSAGEAYERLEALPRWARDDGSLILDGVDNVLAGLVAFDSVIAVDVWLSSANVPVRVRVMQDSDPAGWQEWRRVDAPEEGRSTPPDCGAPSWRRADLTWEPALQMPLQVERTADGHPYDPLSWLGESEELGWVEAGVLSPDGPISVQGGWSNEEDDWDVVVAVELDGVWESDLQVSRFVSSDDWNMAVRAQPVDAEVVRWTTVASEDAWESDLLLSSGESSVFVAWMDWGDLVVGEDGEGRPVAFVVWNSYVPWRALDLPGSPPADVVAREAQLERCLNGEVDPDSTGRCPD